MRVAGLIIATVALGAACTTSRYVGGLGRNGAYVNRGYGIVLDLAAAGLDEGWTLVTEENRTSWPPALRPSRTEAPLDVDGDGSLEVSERTLRYEPTLRLVAGTSTTTTLDLDVTIVSPRQREASLDAIARGRLSALALGEEDARTRAEATLTRRRVAVGFAARVFELPAVRGWPARRVAVIDQAGFLAEENIARRQIVWVTLSEPRLTAEGRRAHDAFLEGLILGRRAGLESTQEQW